MSSSLRDNLTSILNEKLRKVIPENIKAGETIFGVKGTCGALPEVISGKANVYLQRNEPTEKEGIWLQASGLSYDKIIADTSINAKETWEDENRATLPIQFYGGVATVVGTDIYFISGGYEPKYNYKYDTLTKTFTKMTNLPISGSYGSGGGSVAIGTDIFIFKSGIMSSSPKGAYKYDTLNDTYTTLTDTPISMGDGSGGVAAIGTDIYLLNQTSFYKYDTLNDTYTQLKTVPYNAKHGRIISVGTDIYICGSETDTTNKYMYKYDTLNDKYTRMSDIPVTFCQGSLVLYGSDIYMFVNTNAYKYNVITDTYEQIADIPYNFYNGNAVRLNSEIYLIGGQASRTSMRKLNTETKEYPNNSILLLANNTGYATQLIDSKIEGRITTKIVDAWHYTVEKGLNELLPTSYGDGEKWICFKNEDLLLPDEPEESVVVKYIESDGTQYIDTGIKAANDIEFEIKYNQYDFDTKNAHAVVLGSRQTYKSNAFVFFNVLSSNFKNKGIWIGNREDITTTNYTHYQVDTVATFKNGTLTLSSSQGTESHAITMPAAFNSNYNIVLFGSTLANTFEMATKMRLYYCKIWKAGVLVRDFVPHVNEDGEYCLLDNVSGEIFLSPNNNTFAGHSETYSQVESIIISKPFVTDYTPTSNTRVVLDYMDDGSGNYQNVISASGSVKFMIQKDSTSDNYHVFYGATGSGDHANMTISRNVRHVVDFNKNVVYLDGVVAAAREAKEWTLANRYVVDFNTNNSSSAFTIYGIKIYENDELVRDYVPTSKDGSSGLYEKVNKTFFDFDEN